MYSPLPTRAGEQTTSLERLPPMMFDHVDEWKFLKDLEKRKTPASDFMYALFEREVVDILMDPPNSPKILHFIS
jgi:hypothetical protein